MLKNAIKASRDMINDKGGPHFSNFWLAEGIMMNEILPDRIVLDHCVLVCFQEHLL